METYAREFYANRQSSTAHSARVIVSLVLNRAPAIQSAVDVGCGVGTWLAELQAQGVRDVQGFDGHWVDTSLLAIPASCFQQVDLGEAFVELPRSFDLAISLEVAEHLAADRAEGFVKSLTALSDRVLFSAAVPFQGGSGHINEQWQQYWAEHFDRQGFELHDFVRPAIWNDDRIPFWYRQNMLFFSRRPNHGDGVDASGEAIRSSLPLNVVHPELFLNRINEQVGVRNSFKIFRRSLKKYLRGRS